MSEEANEPLLPDGVADDAPAAQDANTPTKVLPATDAPSNAGIWRLLGEARGEACTLTIATVCLIIGSLAMLVFPKVSGNLIDACLRAGQTHDAEAARKELREQLLIGTVVLLLGSIFGGIRAWLFESASSRVMCRLRVRLFSHIIHQDVAFFDVNRTGELTNRLSEDIRMMKDAATVSISMALRSIISMCLGAAMMFATSWRLSTLTLGILPGAILALRLYGHFSRKYTKSQLSSSAAATTVAEECFSSIRTIRSFAKEEASAERYAASVREVMQWGLRNAEASGLFSAFLSGYSMTGMLAILWYGAEQVIDERMSLGDLSAFMLYALYVGSSAGMLGGVIASLIQASGASARAFQLMDRKPGIDLAAPSSRPEGRPEGGQLQLQQVWFAYPSRPTQWVLRGVNLDVEPGSKVALVGTSGGGKSTIIAMAQRFYDPDQGCVMLDGCDLRTIQHSWLHSQVALVAQEPVLFADTILFNITFGMRSTATANEQGHRLMGSSKRRRSSSFGRQQSGAGRTALEGEVTANGVVDIRQVEAAARLANAHDFISRLPEGYNTVVGERGVKLSGGEKQRVAIARALLTQPRVLLLDEATSALDAESEYLVQQALDTAASGRTVMMIAHRLSTVQNADVVAVVADGVIAEKGSHAELLEKGTLYAGLVKRQLTPMEGGASH